MTLPSDIGHDHTWSLRQRDVDVIQKALGNATAEAVPDTAAWFDPEQHSRSLAEIMLDKDLKVRWVVRNLLAKSAVVILAGSPKTGKTTFAVHNIMHVVGPVSYTHLDVYKRQVS